MQNNCQCCWWTGGGEVRFSIVQDEAEMSSDLPTVVQPQPFPLERQKYLADKLRPFVRDDAAKDILFFNS